MSSISYYQYNINRYRTLKTNINSVISYLSMAKNNAESVGNDIKNKYEINDSNTPIFNRAIQLKDNISSTCNYLSNKVIPAIDSAIYSLNREIARIEAEEREKEQEETGD